MGIGHKQQSFIPKTKWNHYLRHGGELRKKRTGRGSRPLSMREPLHVVFKAKRGWLRHQSLRSPFGFLLIQKVMKTYAQHFHVQIEQVSIQHDHIHLLIRTSRRSQFHYFFRVVAGQIAQRFEKEGLLGWGKAKAATDTPTRSRRRRSLWMHRPFSRVVRGYKAYIVVRNYIQLNEKEVTGKIRYQKNRLRGLSTSDWSLLWE